MTQDEASVVCVLPDGEARTRGPSRLEHLGVGAGPPAKPLEEVEDQSVNVVGHSRLEDSQNDELALAVQRPVCRLVEGGVELAQLGTATETILPSAPGSHVEQLPERPHRAVRLLELLVGSVAVSVMLSPSP